MTRPGAVRFGPYELDTVRRVLRCDGTVVPLSGKPMEVLLALVEHRDRVVSREELLRSIWPDVVVEEANLTQNVSVLRRTLGEGPGDHTYILTVTGNGYRFVADVEPGQPPERPVEATSSRGRRRWAALGLLAALVGVAAAVAMLVAALERIAGASRESPPLEPRTIAVLPFLTEGFDRPAGSRGIGLAGSVIGRLAQAGFSVRPTGAVLEFADPRRDSPQQAGRALGAGLVVTGELREGESSARLSLQVIDTRHGSALWGGSVEVEAGDDLDERISRAAAESLADALASVVPREDPG